MNHPAPATRRGLPDIPGVRRGLAILLCAAGLTPGAMCGASPEPIASVSVDRAARITTLELANGVVVHYRRVPGASMLSLCLTLDVTRAGDTEADRAMALAAISAIRSPLPLGVPMFTAAPEGLKMEYHGPRGPLERQLGRMVDLLVKPEIDPEAVGAWRERTLRTLSQDLADPAAVAARALNRLLGEGSARGPLSPAAVSRVTVEDLAAWQRRAWSAATIEVGVSADLAPDDVLPVIVESLARIAPRPPVRAAAPHTIPEPVPSRTSQLTADMPPGDAVVLAAYGAPGLDRLGDYRALVVAKSVLRDRLAQRVRAAGLLLQDDGLSVALAPGRGSGRGLLIFSVRVHGDADAAAIAAGVLDRLIRESREPGLLTPDEVRVAGETIAAEAETTQADTRYWARVLSVLRREGWDPAELASAPSAYRSMPADAVRAALHAWVVPEQRCAVLISSEQAPPGFRPAGGP